MIVGTFRILLPSVSGRTINRLSWGKSLEAVKEVVSAIFSHDVREGGHHPPAPHTAFNDASWKGADRFGQAQILQEKFFGNHAALSIPAVEPLMTDPCGESTINALSDWGM